MPEITKSTKKKKAKIKKRGKRSAPAANPSPMYAQLLDPNRLWNAWRVIDDSARRSKARDTKAEAEKFKGQLTKNLERLRGQLRRKTFRFGLARGVLIEKDDGSKRPLVVAPIVSRVVQRAILDVLNEVPRIQAIHGAGHNFGGVPGEGYGVPGAVKMVKAHAQTHQHFFRTDIRSFFRKVNREQALAALLEGIGDKDFCALVRMAVNVELNDTARYGDDITLFPLLESGVAQGSCLSPLLCNVLLHDFDVEMQGRGIVTIRYIDDFIVLGPSAAKASAAFNSGLAKLKAMGLECYDPRNPEHRDKAETGVLSLGAEFLGCHVSTAAIRPSDENRANLMKKLEGLKEESLRHATNPAQAQRKGVTYLDALNKMSLTLQGWSNTFGFSTDARLMRDIDRQVSQMLSDFQLRAQQARGSAKMNEEDWRRFFGVWLAQDALEQEMKSGL